MTIKEYLELTKYDTYGDIEIDVYRIVKGYSINLSNGTLSIKQILKSKLKDLKIDSVEIVVSGLCGDISITFNVKI